MNITVNEKDCVKKKYGCFSFLEMDTSLHPLSKAYNSITAAQNAKRITKYGDASNSHTTLPSQTDPLFLPAEEEACTEYTGEREVKRPSIANFWHAMHLGCPGLNTSGSRI